MIGSTPLGSTTVVTWMSKSSKERDGEQWHGRETIELPNGDLQLSGVYHLLTERWENDQEVKALLNQRLVVIA